MKELDDLTPILTDLPRESVVEPRLPMAVFLQEAHDLHALVSQQSVRGELEKIGVDTNLLDTLGTNLSAARQAQSQWAVTRDRSKTDAQRALEEGAAELRSELMAACRWSLRSDRVALATLRAIAEGDGIADLVQDLADLARLIETRQAAFAADTSFDAVARIREAQATAEQLRVGVSQEKLAADQAKAKELRDRAFTYLYDQVLALREAGRYAFRRDPATQAKFGSLYYRRRSRAQVRQEEPGVPVEA